MHRIVWFDVTDSTNLRLKQDAETAENGLVYAAGEQTAGRGRLDRKWLSRPGTGAWFSCLVKDSRVNGDNVSGIVFACALAVSEALTDLTGNNGIKVKWPNDIVINGKKICGILCESGFEGARVAWTVCGIGINLNADSFPEELPWAASVKSETGAGLETMTVINAVLSRLDAALETLLTCGLRSVLEELKPVSATLGSRVKWEENGREYSGECVSFAEDGSLNVMLDGEIRVLRVGDVSVRGVMGYV